jgi:hypothetical protein
MPTNARSDFFSEKFPLRERRKPDFPTRIFALAERREEGTLTGGSGLSVAKKYSAKVYHACLLAGS